MIVELLFTANCATVNVLHTKHPDMGDRGQYFFFDENDFTKMVGETDWNAKTFEVIQGGSKSWIGNITVWDSSHSYGANGRRLGYTTAKIGDWVDGDTIQLKSCVEAGI